VVSVIEKPGKRLRQVRQQPPFSEVARACGPVDTRQIGTSGRMKE
jgi:hypothetical protein